MNNPLEGEVLPARGLQHLIDATKVGPTLIGDDGPVYDGTAG